MTAGHPSASSSAEVRLSRGWFDTLSRNTAVLTIRFDRWDEGLVDMCIGEKRTLTVPPSYGYGQRSIGPIPAGATLVFETELIGIDYVPKPESIVYKKAAEKAEEAASTVEEKVAEATDKAGEEIADATEKAGEASANVAEKVASVVSGAAEAVKTVVADTDDVQEHNEL